MLAMGFELRSEANLETLTLDVLRSSEIEGEVLDQGQVRSSIARRLGMDIGGLVPSDRHVDGVVDMMLDATTNYNKPLTKERLFSWHAALFPTGYSGLYKIKVGDWRDDSTGPMQVVSGAMGKARVHFQAPDAALVDHEMQSFLQWIANEEKLDPVLKAAVAHFWFITIHPFEDGNGRIARALSDLLLARADGLSQRFYSLSARIRKERKGYYQILEQSQKGNLDISSWIQWFLQCLSNALADATEITDKVFRKHQFWNRHLETPFNERQRYMLHKLLDDFYGKLTSSKWAKMSKCSTDTALRDIQDLVQKGILVNDGAGGRSTAYVLSKYM